MRGVGRTVWGGVWRTCLVSCLFAASLAACEPTEEEAMNGGDATFTSLYEGYLGECAQCHAPGAPGRTSDIEQTLDFSSRASAYATLVQGQASGLVGNQEACNGVPFVAQSYETSLLAATLDGSVRAQFSGFGACDGDAISDMTVKVGYAPSGAFLDELEAWIDSGAPND